MTTHLPVFGAFLFFCVLNHVAGSGSLIEPRQRSSLWRNRTIVYRNPIVKPNYQDYNLNCGGSSKLTQYRGRCGVCGDAWDLPQPRPNEAGGTYAKGIIAKTYPSNTQYIHAVVEVINARVSISGYFKFNICPNNNVNKPVTEQCFNLYPMNIFSKNMIPLNTKYYPDVKAVVNDRISLMLEIPKGMTCSQCVLRWKWIKAYSYGRTEPIQNCADIAILPTTNQQTPPTAAPTPPPPTAAPPTAAPTPPPPTPPPPTPPPTAAPTPRPPTPPPTAAPTPPPPTPPPTAAPTPPTPPPPTPPPTAAPTPPTPPPPTPPPTAAPTPPTPPPPTPPPPTPPPTAAPTPPTPPPPTPPPPTPPPPTPPPTAAPTPPTPPPPTPPPTGATINPNIHDALKPFVTSGVFVPDPNALPP